MPERTPQHTTQRDWFLRGSSWEDATWILAPTNALTEEAPVRLHWDFKLPSGERFTDPPHRELLASARQHLALMRTHSVLLGHAMQASTIGSIFLRLRVLIRWMSVDGFHHLRDLDARALERFIQSIRERKGRRGATLNVFTVALHLQLLVYLYRHRHSIEDALLFDPLTGLSPEQYAGARPSHRKPLPYTPEGVAIPLIGGAIEFLSAGAIDLLRARERYVQTCTHAHRHRLSYYHARQLKLRALQTFTIQTPRGPVRIESLSQLCELIDMLYAACFVVIAYLVGPRASEILHLQAGCVRPLEGTPEPSAALIAGAIYKDEAAYHGRAHVWVAAPAAVHAITVLEALSAPHRMRSARTALFLHPQHRRAGNAQWLTSFTQPLTLADHQWLKRLLGRFGRWLALPDHEGRPWRLTSHQGRKTFARFVALRDRTALFALAQQLGHRDTAITDTGYVGTDFQLHREIDSQVLEQSVSAWEHMLSSPTLGGRAGAEIVTQRPRFRGARLKEDIQNYARMLVDAGLTLGVCDYGYCVYRQEYSACLGDVQGPNPVRREPSTCARCKNFVVGEEHRPYWQGQLERHEALLNNPDLPTQTLKIARSRLAEARNMLRSIDSHASLSQKARP